MSCLPDWFFAPCSVRLPLRNGALGVLGMGVMAMAAQGANELADAQPPSDALTELTRPASWIETGMGTTHESPFSVGAHRALDPQGGFLIGNFELRGSQYSYGNDGDDMTRWSLTGSNLGLSSRSLSAEYGQQGVYRLTFGVDDYLHVYSDSYQTPFLGAGSTRLTLPSGFVRAADTGAMGTLGASMRRFDVQTTRERAEVGLGYWIDRNWELRFGMRNDAREGARIRGAEFGSNGGNPRAMLLPEPINASTQVIDASLSRNAENHRFSVSYLGSIYRNRISSLTWQNPYTSAPWVGTATGLPAGFPLTDGQIGVAPDNEFHQLGFTGSYDFSSTTRLSLTGTRGRMTQNESFLPYTITPGLTTTGLPRASLDGLVDTTFLHARLSMRPVRNLSLVASLRRESRENRTPQSEFIYIGGDIQLQPLPASATDRIRTNLPRSTRKENLSLEAVYRASASRTATVGWERDEVRRTFAEVEQATENTYRVELRQGGTGPWTGQASYAWLARRGTQYLYNLPFLASYTSSAYVNGLAAANGCTDLIYCVRSGPFQNKFYLADRDRERLRLVGGYAPDAVVSLTARMDLNRDRYPHSPYGVVDARNWSAGADLGYVVNDDLSTTLFYSREDQRSRERGRQITNPNPAVASTTAADWVNHMADRATSIGFGFKYKGLLGGRLELEADASAVRSRTPISTTVGPAVSAAWNPATALPDLTARSASINVSARYAVDRENSIKVSYLYRRLSSTNWAYQQVGAATLASVIGTNEEPARYAVHGLGISYIHWFR